MASAVKKVDKIRQIVQLKQMMKRWKTMGLGRRSAVSHSESDSEAESTNSTRRIPSGSLAVYVGPQRRRFVIPTRFLNLPIFVALLKKSEEEFGFQSSGGLVLPCEVRFFKGVIKVLQKDEGRFGKMKLEEFLKMFAEVGFDPCRDSHGKDSGYHHHHHHHNGSSFTPLLKARV